MTKEQNKLNKYRARTWDDDRTWLGFGWLWAHAHCDY